MSTPVHTSDERTATTTPATAPPGTWWLHWRGRSVVIPRRSAVVGVVLTIAALALAITALGLGSTHHGWGEVIDALRGAGSRSTQLVILEWRMPRILLGLTVGAALGTAGAIFQGITRNPLGSPDLIGFTMGAQTGILVAVLVAGGSFVSVSLASLLGGLAVGAIIYALSFRGGFGGLRLILAGIAVSSLLSSFNRWLIVRADPDSAYGALKAVTGTLASADWVVAGPCAVAVVVVIAAIMIGARPLRSLELGPDLATVLGTRVQLLQSGLILLGTALVALATMAAGPLSFVALVAPHIARMLAKDTSAGLYISAATGALLLLGADVISQTLLGSLPVGVVTAAVGGLYFMGLLIAEAGSRRA